MARTKNQATKMPYRKALAIWADLEAGLSNTDAAKLHGVSKDTAGRVRTFGPQCWAPGGKVPCDNRDHRKRGKLFRRVSPHKCPDCGGKILTATCLACHPPLDDAIIEGTRDPDDTPMGDELQRLIAEVQAGWTPEQRRKAMVVKERRRIELQVVACRDLKLAAMESPVWQTI